MKFGYHDSFYWNNLLFREDPVNKFIQRDKDLGKLRIIRGNVNNPDVTGSLSCTLCDGGDKRSWVPKLHGSIDVGIKLVYTCSNCGRGLMTIDIINENELEGYLNDSRGIDLDIDITSVNRG